MCDVCLRGVTRLMKVLQLFYYFRIELFIRHHHSFHWETLDLEIEYDLYNNRQVTLYLDVDNFLIMYKHINSGSIEMATFSVSEYFFLVLSVAVLRAHFGS